MGVGQKDIFVFAVCGADENVHEVNLAIRHLQQFSNNEILVVTDLKRNSAGFDHPNVLDVPTPEPYDHHQASLYLKTRLHRIVDLRHRYCYLDSDVLALARGVDNIFLYKQGPVTFTSDHCRLPAFSPSAMNCGCQAWKRAKVKELSAFTARFYPDIPSFSAYHEKQYCRFKAILVALEDENRRQAATLKEGDPKLLVSMKEWKDNQLRDPELLKKREELIDLLREAWAGNYLDTVFGRVSEEYRRNWRQKESSDKEGNVILAQRMINFFWKEYSFSLDPPMRNWHNKSNKLIGLPPHNLQNVLAAVGLPFNAATCLWEDVVGTILMHDVIPAIEAESDFRYDYSDGQWKDAEGAPVYFLTCNHLVEQIGKTFGIEVTDPNWQHWNGGVFLFDLESVEFMDTWHAFTMKIFDDPVWSTRDQGTLVAAAWKHGMQNQHLLPIEFNFLADYHSPSLRFDPGKGFSLDCFNSVIHPFLVHIYHHFGDQQWPVWRWVSGLLESEKASCS